MTIAEPAIETSDLGLLFTDGAAHAVLGHDWGAPDRHGEVAPSGSKFGRFFLGDIKPLRPYLYGSP